MESTKQSALSHRGKPGHHRNAQLFGVICVDPVLKLQNFGVTVKQVRRENGIHALLATRRVYNEEACRRQHHRWAHQLLNPSKAQVEPRHNSPGSENEDRKSTRLNSSHITISYAV